MAQKSNHLLKIGCKDDDTNHSLELEGSLEVKTGRNKNELEKEQMAAKLDRKIVKEFEMNCTDETKNRLQQN